VSLSEARKIYVGICQRIVDINNDKKSHGKQENGKFFHIVTKSNQMGAFSSREIF
jgi:hypothetical protein